MQNNGLSSQNAVNLPKPVKQIIKLKGAYVLLVEHRHLWLLVAGAVDFIKDEFILFFHADSFCYSHRDHSVKLYELLLKLRDARLKLGNPYFRFGLAGVQVSYPVAHAVLERHEVRLDFGKACLDVGLEVHRFVPLLRVDQPKVF